MGHGSEQRTSHAPVDRTCMNCSMSPFVSGLLEQASVADGELRSQLKYNKATACPLVCFTALAALVLTRWDFLKARHGQRPPPFSYGGPGVVHKNLSVPRGGEPNVVARFLVAHSKKLEVLEKPLTEEGPARVQ